MPFAALTRLALRVSNGKRQCHLCSSFECAATCVRIFGVSCFAFTCSTFHHPNPRRAAVSADAPLAGARKDAPPGQLVRERRKVRVRPPLRRYRPHVPRVGTVGYSDLGMPPSDCLALNVGAMAEIMP